ncbi:MAG TPA: hypothetical protein DEA55_10385 [Rhodospirillaceae bacterium]|nr:hypothetical protein [Rhodospirillaceae bacterium]
MGLLGNIWKGFGYGAGGVVGVKVGESAMGSGKTIFKILRTTTTILVVTGGIQTCAFETELAKKAVEGRGVSDFVTTSLKHSWDHAVFVAEGLGKVVYNGGRWAFNYATGDGNKNTHENNTYDMP